LEQLTAEDLRLLLNGVGDIHVGTLISYTSFNDESNESSDKLLKFKRWLWSVVEKMSNLERQDLVRTLNRPVVKGIFIFIHIPF
jgi:E3 ubiquitin-protein ligase EDD1